MRWSCFAVCTLLFVATERCSAITIYVDNSVGYDVFDGTSAEPVDKAVGPVRTLRRAMLLARTGDTIVLKNNGIPYYDSISLDGQGHSGYSNAEFTIVGNGAVLDGSAVVPPEAWRPAGENLWSLTPWRKGYYLLLLDDQPVPEVAATAELPQLAAGQWCAWHGSIYYRPVKGDPPANQPFRLAVETVGLGMIAVDYVRIRDLTLRHFRVDGVNAHDRCRHVILENVTATANGRAGLSVNGSSKISVQGGNFADNRKHDVQFSELGTAQFDQTHLGSPLSNDLRRP